MNTKTIQSLALAGFILAGLAGAQAQTNYVPNGGFESLGDLVFDGNGATQIYTTPSEERYDFGTGWYTTLDPVHIRQSGSLGVVTADGGNYLSIGTTWFTNYTWQQRRFGLAETYFTLAPATTYTLSFDVKLASTTADWTRLFWGLTANGATIATVADGAPTFYWGAASGQYGAASTWVDDGDWAHIDYTFTSSEDADEVYRLFFNLSASGNAISTTESILAIDNVSITAVPEPAMYAALFGASALGFALWRRPRRQTPLPRHRL